MYFTCCHFPSSSLYSVARIVGMIIPWPIGVLPIKIKSDLDLFYGTNPSTADMASLAQWGFGQFLCSLLSHHFAYITLQPERNHIARYLEWGERVSFWNLHHMLSWWLVWFIYERDPSWMVAALDPPHGGVSNGPSSIYRLIITNHPPRPASAIFLPTQETLKINSKEIIKSWKHLLANKAHPSWCYLHCFLRIK